MSEVTSSDSDVNIIRPAHAGVFATVSVFGFLILRIFAVSGYDWETAFVVSTTLSVDSGYLNILTDQQEFMILISSDVISRE